jgi:hypothetical protein
MKDYANTGKGEFRPGKCEGKNKQTLVIENPPGHWFN